MPRNLTGIMLWKITSNPILALYFAILADFTGMIPALIKTYHHPETEVWMFYIMDSMAGLLSLLALSKWILVEFSYPFYIMLINAMVLLIVHPRLRLEK